MGKLVIQACTFGGGQDGRVLSTCSSEEKTKSSHLATRQPPTHSAAEVEMGREKDWWKEMEASAPHSLNYPSSSSF